MWKKKKKKTAQAFFFNSFAQKFRVFLAVRVCPSALFNINFPFLSKEGNNSVMLFDKILYIILENIDIKLFVFEI